MRWNRLIGVVRLYNTHSINEFFFFKNIFCYTLSSVPNIYVIICNIMNYITKNIFILINKFHFIKNYNMFLYI